jgi:hypothetical protein
LKHAKKLFLFSTTDLDAPKIATIPRGQIKHPLTMGYLSAQDIQALHRNEDWNP